MTIFRFRISLVRPLLLSGYVLILACSAESGEGTSDKSLTTAETDKKLCESHVLKNLINPETFQPFEFAALREGDAGWRNMDFMKPVGNEPLRQYRFRYKAQSKVGLTVTSLNHCGVLKHIRSGELFCVCTEAV
jgi:hypothetical protein